MGRDDLVWLAGFLDADGMIRLKIGMKNERGPKSLIPMVTFTNTCCYTVKEIARILGWVANVGFKIQTSEGRFGWVENGLTKSLYFNARIEDRLHLAPEGRIWKPKSVVEVYGLRRCVPLLRAIRPFLKTKACEADLLLRFSDIRYQNRQRPYGTEEYRIFEALKHLKATRHLRDYMPSAEQVLSEDIVRTNAKALEAAEMSARLTLEERREWTRNLVSRYRWHREENQGSDLFADSDEVTKVTERH